MKRIGLLSLGWASVVLGVIGIFLPLLPTTPFLLLASWCFARSSRKFHTWLHEHKRLGPMVSAWESGEGLETKVKLRIILFLWLSMGLSMILVQRWPATFSLIFIGSCVSIYIWRQPTKKS